MNRTAARWRGCGLALLLATACSTTPPTWDEIKTDLRRRYPDVPLISATELAQWLADPNRPAPLLLDVRTPAEFAVSHLRGAARAGTTNPPPAAALVVYCSVGYRSTAYAAELRRAGHTRVQQLDGSIFQWANEGHPLYRGTNQVQVVHPYNATWATLLRPGVASAPGQ